MTVARNSREIEALARRIDALENAVTSLELSRERVLLQWFLGVTPRQTDIFLGGGVALEDSGLSCTPGSPAVSTGPYFESHILLVVNTLGVAGTVQLSGTRYSFLDDTTNPFYTEDIVLDTTTTDTSTASTLGIPLLKLQNAYMSKASWASAVTLTSDGTLNAADIDAWQVVIQGTASPGAQLNYVGVVGQSDDAAAGMDLATTAFDFTALGKGDVASDFMDVAAGEAPVGDVIGRGNAYNLTFPNIAQFGGYGGSNLMMSVTPTNADAWINVTVQQLNSKPPGGRFVTSIDAS